MTAVLLRGIAMLLLVFALAVGFIVVILMNGLVPPFSYRSFSFIAGCIFLTAAIAEVISKEISPKTAIDMVFFSGRWIPALSLGYIAWKLVSPSGEAAKTPEELSAARFFLLLIGILSAYEALRLYKKSR